MNLNLKFNKKAPTGYSKQVQHSVYLDSKIIGTVYDNRACEKKENDFNFLASAGGVAGNFLPRENTDYLLRPGFKGNDLKKLLAEIRIWAGEIKNWFENYENEMRKMLDGLELPVYEMNTEYTDQILTAHVLCKTGSADLKLSWDDMAKIHGHSYSECSDYQVTDSGLRGKCYGLKWSYFQGAKTISINTYSMRRVMTITRTEDHKKFDAK